MQAIPTPAGTLTAEQALQHADWYTRYALDRLGNDGRLYHPGVRTHLIAARTQLVASEDLAKPECDQVEA